ncbi:MAG: hypothetical protein J6Y06_04830, partial [Bacteroidales bacterium]|nr:hypothetical protein [Bacteroidales bacterium]
MKTIDEIEKLSMEDLERISADESIIVPDGLESRVFQPKDNRPRWWTAISIAASLIVLAGIGLAWYNRSKPLEDTFDDPALAYAMVEETLAKMSQNLEIGVKSVEKSRD